ncbi:MAG: hypothetical protein V1704_02055 [Candidatus Vogelbacteria bacterium]
MEGFESRPQEQEVRRADFMRRELEQFPFIKNPIEQWSDQEKDGFLDWCRRFNNFWRTVTRALKNVQYDIIPKEAFKWDEVEIAKAVESGNSSEKYCNSTYTQFFKNVKQTLIDSGVDMDDLSQTLNNMEDDYRAGIARHNSRKKFDRKDFEKAIDNAARFYVGVLPAILALIDSGYTEMELER